MAVRMAQALQLNVESYQAVPPASSDDELTSDPESRRRLMRSLYIMDSWVGSGVDEFTLLKEPDLKVRFPCMSTSFSYNRRLCIEMT